VQLIIDGAASIKEEIAGRPKAGILDKGMTMVLDTVIVLLLGSKLRYGTTR
jgi:hypothetical protein